MLNQFLPSLCEGVEVNVSQNGLPIDLATVIVFEPEGDGDVPIIILESKRLKPGIQILLAFAGNTAGWRAVFEGPEGRHFVNPDGPVYDIVPV